jgi:hypothetical protein
VTIAANQFSYANEYNLDYFSGAQAHIYIGGILLDEVTSLQWSVHQSKIPIYGYASQRFSEMAKGTIIVQGQLSINFIEPNYLYSVLHAVNNKTAPMGHQNNENKFNDQLKQSLNAFSENQDPKEQWKAIRALDKKSKDNTNNYFFKKMNDVLWGPSEAEKTQTTNGRVDDSSVNGFDIKIDFKWEDSAQAQTSQTIKNVHILGGSRALMIDEQPIQEVYSFYAQGLENLIPISGE